MGSWTVPHKKILEFFVLTLYRSTRPPKKRRHCAQVSKDQIRIVEIDSADPKCQLDNLTETEPKTDLELEKNGESSKIGEIETPETVETGNDNGPAESPTEPTTGNDEQTGNTEITDESLADALRKLISHRLGCPVEHYTFWAKIEI